MARENLGNFPRETDRRSGDGATPVLLFPGQSSRAPDLWDWPLAAAPASATALIEQASDILGRDLTHDAVLLVENQLEPSDHSHLGQLLTYAAGTGASTVVWVANPFREEHRQALDWLNQMTDEAVRFFGVEMEILRIGDSLPAPRLFPWSWPLPCPRANA